VTVESADHPSPDTTIGEDETSLLEDGPAFDTAVGDAVEDAEVAASTGTSPLVENGPAFQEAVDRAVADARPVSDIAQNGAAFQDAVNRAVAEFRS